MSLKPEQPKDKAKDTAQAQGQQQKGNHGGGGLSNKAEGNQPRANSADVQQRDVDGDMPGGRKGKK